MKLRIRGNSIRLRLTQSEIVQFKTSVLVEEKVESEFPQKQIVYALEFEENYVKVKTILKRCVYVFLCQKLNLTY